MAYDGSEPIKSLGGDLVPQVWDDTLGGGAGAWRVITVADMAGQPPLAAPSGNVPLTTVPNDGGQHALAGGTCVYGLQLTNDPDSAARLYYGATGIDASRGDVLEPGDRAWVPVTDAGAVFVMAAGAGVQYRGLRY